MALLQLKDPKWQRATVGQGGERWERAGPALETVSTNNLLPAAGKGREAGKKQVRNTMEKEILRLH